MNTVFFATRYTIRDGNIVLGRGHLNYMKRIYYEV